MQFLNFREAGWLVFWLLLSCNLSGQSTTLPLHSQAQQTLDRMLITTQIPNDIHPEVQPWFRKDAVLFTRQADTLEADMPDASRRDLRYLFDENNEWVSPDDTVHFRKTKKLLFGIFYRTPANLFEVNKPFFQLRVNPLLNFSLGPEANSSSLIFNNQRGLAVRGNIDGRFYFHTDILETQVRLPNYVNQWIDNYQSIPGAGFFKKFNSKLFDTDRAYDFNLANAYVGARVSQHIDIQLGHGQHFIGNGYRSLFLSDVGNYTFYLKLSTRVWRFHYQNLFLELSPISTAVPRPPNSILPKKYIAAHYLNFHATPNLAFGFFEATVFNRSRQFELQYLNPVILYRTVEGMIGSPDNVLLGFDFRWNFLRRFQLYGQVLIDEFLFSEAINPDQKGWWGNKFGWQAGLKYINAFGADHLDLQLEYNAVRPYTYSSFDSLNSYTHYNQPLAHPLWANFREIVSIARYKPHPRLFLTGRFLYAIAGENPENENQGANPLLGNSSRQMEYGNVIGQGVRADIRLLGLDVAWQLWHNLFVETRFFMRWKNSDEERLDSTTRYIALGIRWNVWNKNRDF